MEKRKRGRFDNKMVIGNLRHSDQPVKSSRSRKNMENGFALEPALMMFGLILILCASICITAQSRAALIQASDRSSLDLAVIDRAADFAGECSWSRRCSLSAPPESFHETIHHRDVLFRDEGTRIRARYSEKGRVFSVDLYYDESGVIRVEYSQ